MCGRYAVYSNPTEIAKHFAVKQPFQLIRSYNIAPTEDISVLFELPEGERTITTMRWGLIPSWQETKNTSTSHLINARAETIDIKPAFRSAVKHRRCLIIADGFFEWKKERNIKQPYFVHLKNKQPFAMAGVWEKWEGKGECVDSCCIITRKANELLSHFHDRMPVLIQPNDYHEWLDSSNHNWENLKHLLSPKDHTELEIYPVSSSVNKSTFKSHVCILPV